jgi:hypothetical protein
MVIIGTDYHPSFQQITFVDTEAGGYREQRLEHREDAEKSYRDLVAQGVRIKVGMETSGHARWFERLDQSRGRTADFALAAGRSFSTDLGAESGKPGSPATVMATGTGWCRRARGS